MNRMVVYAPNDVGAGIDGPANGVLVRADVHVCLCSHAFVFYPAGDSLSGPGFEMVAHKFVGYEYSDFPELLHRRRVGIHLDVPVQFLYARFAYAIVSLLIDNLAPSVEESDVYKEAEEQMEGKERAKECCEATHGVVYERGGGEDDGA